MAEDVKRTPRPGKVTHVSEIAKCRSVRYGTATKLPSFLLLLVDHNAKGLQYKGRQQVNNDFHALPPFQTLSPLGRRMMTDKPISPAAVAAPLSLDSPPIAEVLATASGTADRSQNSQEISKDVSDAKDPSEKKAFEVTDQTNMLPARQIIPVFLGLMAAVLVSTLDQSIVSTAIPTIAAHFNAGQFFSLAT